MGFIKKILNFFRLLKVVNVLWNAYRVVILFENVFYAPFSRLFGKKSESFLTLEKLANVMKKKSHCFSEQKTFSFFKITKSGKRRICR